MYVKINLVVRSRNVYTPLGYPKSPIVFKLKRRLL
jgi:hypothetical protein